jgi:citronellol/citronellal dehydrogenase
VKAIPGMRAKGGRLDTQHQLQGSGTQGRTPVPIPPLIAGQCLYGGSKAMLDRLTTGAAMEL